MARLSIVLTIALLASQPAIADDATNGLPASDPVSTIYLFGASWCAPCIVELRDLRRIAAATAPDRIVVVWAASGIARFVLPKIANVAIASDRTAQFARTLWARGNAGLPFSAMVDSRGRKCAERQG